MQRARCVHAVCTVRALSALAGCAHRLHGCLGTVLGAHTGCVCARGVCRQGCIACMHEGAHCVWCCVLTGLCAGASAFTMLQKEQRQPQESVLEDSAWSQHCSAHLHPVRAAPPGVCWRGHAGGP